MGHSADGASGEWRLNYGTLDLIAAYQFNCLSCLNIIPNFGVRFAVINNHFAANYDNINYIFAGAQFLTTPHSDTIVDNYMTSGGLKMGIDFETPLRFGISLFGNVGGSLLFGYYQLSEKVHGWIPEVNAGVPHLNTQTIHEKYNLYRMNTSFESELGLAFNRCIGSCQLQLSASYCFNYWLNQSFYYNLLFTNEPIAELALFQNFFDFEKISSNLQMQGLILGIHFFF